MLIYIKIYQLKMEIDTRKEIDGTKKNKSLYNNEQKYDGKEM